MRNHRFAVAAIAGVVALAVTSGCSTKGGGAGTAKTGDDGVKTDFGVTKDTITLGDLTDNSGPFKVSGISLAHGYQVWIDDTNKAGGICGRQIEVDLQDMGYATEKAVSLYAGMKDDILGLISIVGSPMIAALKAEMTNNNVIFMPDSWASSNLDTPMAMMIGPSYDLEMINGLAYLQEQGIIADGDKIGHVYVDSEYGQNGLEGSKNYAEQHNMTVVEGKLTASDVDMSSIVTKIKSEDVKVLLVTTTPVQTGAVATQALNQGLDVPILGNNPSFDATLLNTPAAPALLKNFMLMNYAVPFSDPAMSKVATAYTAATTDPPNKTAAYGYVAGVIWGEILQKACDEKDLSREGVVKVAKSLSEVDTKGITAPLDFSLEGEPSSRASFILKPDAAQAGGLTTLEAKYESKEAKEYKTPYQK